MRRTASSACRSLLWIAAVSAFSFGILGDAQAQIPDLVRHYRLLPRHSVLTQTGGFAGVHFDHRVLGTYDFVTTHEPWAAKARFANVDAWASVISPNPMPAVVIDVDKVLNLSNLEGRQLPVAAPFDVFRFEGTTEDGSSVRLLTALLGRWMVLRGETTAPVGSADFFEYQLRAVARLRPAPDMNFDLLIDGHDLEVWKSRFGEHSAAVALSSESADANDDGLVDGADLLAWQQSVGETPPDFHFADGILSSALAQQAAIASAVPEPSAAWLVLAGSVFLGRRYACPDSMKEREVQEKVGFSGFCFTAWRSPPTLTWRTLTHAISWN